MTTHRLTVYSISQRGVLPQFYHDEPTAEKAGKWRRDFLDECAKVGAFVRIDRDPKHEGAIEVDQLIRNAIDRDPKSNEVGE